MFYIIRNIILLILLLTIVQDLNKGGTLEENKSESKDVSIKTE